MTGWALLEARTETHPTELDSAIEVPTSHYRNTEPTSDFEVEANNAPQPLITPEAHRARRPIMANVAKLQSLLVEPVDFLQELARQVGLSLLLRRC